MGWGSKGAGVSRPGRVRQVPTLRGSGTSCSAVSQQGTRVSSQRSGRAQVRAGGRL